MRLPDWTVLPAVGIAVLLIARSGVAGGRMVKGVLSESGPATVPVIVVTPAVAPLATVIVATPLALVVAVVGGVITPKAPMVNVTTAPLTGLPRQSLT